jgi:hypothetical protein
VHGLGTLAPAVSELSIRLQFAGDLTFGASSLSGTLSAYSVGLLGGSTSNQVRTDWSVNLRRTADLPAGATFTAHASAPARTDDAEELRTDTELPWSLAALNVMGGAPRPFFEAQDPALIDQWLKGYHTGGGGGLFDCEWENPTTLPNYVRMPALLANSICAASNWDTLHSKAPTQPFAYWVLASQFAAGAQ